MPIVRNKKTGVVTSVPSHYVGHPVLGANLELVDDKQKSVVAPIPKKGKIAQELTAPEVAPVLVQPETTSKELEDGN